MFDISRRDLGIVAGFAFCVLTLAAVASAEADPDVPGFDVTVYAPVLDPIRMSFESTGSLVDTLATGLGPFPQFAIGRGGVFGSDVYVIRRTSSDLLRIDPSGNQTTIGTGFGTVSDMAFGPDQFLYVAEFDNDRVLRIAPPGVGVSSAPVRTVLASYPNPFSSKLTVPFDVAQPGIVSIAVYDVSGRLVAPLLSAWRPTGSHAVAWDGRDAIGRDLPAGTYLIRVEPTGVSARVVKLR